MRDLLLDTDGDILIESGDLAIGNSDLQHQHDILRAHKGSYKEHPEIGVGIIDDVNNDNPNDLLRRIRANFEYDGMTVQSLKIKDNGNLAIDASY